MTVLKMMAMGAGGGPVSVTPWSDISFSSPMTQLSNEDRTLSFPGGARTISVLRSGGGTLEYRINSGSWTVYSGGFSMSSGQTLGWRWGNIGNASDTVQVIASIGGTFDTFNLSATGF